MTIPDKPRSSKQKYRLTDKGRQAMRQQGGRRAMKRDDNCHDAKSAKED